MKNYYDVQVEFASKDSSLKIKFKRDLRHVPATDFADAHEKTRQYYETFTSLLNEYKIISISSIQEAPFLDIYKEIK